MQLFIGGSGANTPEHSLEYDVSGPVLAPPELPGPQANISLLDQHSTLKKKAEEVIETAKDIQV